MTDNFTFQSPQLQLYHLIKSSKASQIKAGWGLLIKSKHSMVLSHEYWESFDGAAGCYWAVTFQQLLAEFVNNCTEKLDE